jgi:hypothetical protein
MPDLRQKSDETLSAQVCGFAKREYVAVLLSASLSAICAGLIRLFVSDHAFDALLMSKYLPPAKTFDDPSRYIPYALVVGFTAALVFAIQLPKVAVRGIKLWWLGVTSGLWFLPLVVTLFLLKRHTLQIPSPSSGRGHRDHRKYCFRRLASLPRYRQKKACSERERYPSIHGRKERGRHGTNRVRRPHTNLVGGLARQGRPCRLIVCKTADF